MVKHVQEGQTLYHHLVTTIPGVRKKEISPNEFFHNIYQSCFCDNEGKNKQMCSILFLTSLVTIRDRIYSFRNCPGKKCASNDVALSSPSIVSPSNSNFTTTFFG
mmetsp:Transcript_32517/g.58760  ORF Transcript_32517/g.58760 Transcript_32517/m.58760 type:complete len:105 (-) Transcript_32517:1063-1377(-)